MRFRGAVDGTAAVVIQRLISSRLAGWCAHTRAPRASGVGVANDGDGDGEADQTDDDEEAVGGRSKPAADEQGEEAEGEEGSWAGSAAARTRCCPPAVASQQPAGQPAGKPAS